MASDLQAAADKQGITEDQYIAFLTDPATANYGLQVTHPNQSNQSGGGGDSDYAVRNRIAQAKQEGLIGNKNTTQQSTQQSNTPQTYPGGIDPNQSAVNTGAALLGQKAYYNPTPGKADPKTGAGPTNPSISSAVPKLSDVGGIVATTPGIGMARPAVAPSQTTVTQPTPQANAALMSSGVPNASPPSFEAFQPNQQMAMLQTGSPSGHQTYKTAAGGTNTIVTR